MSGASPWTIRLTLTARSQLAAIRDTRVRGLVAKRIDELAHDPQQQGKPLVGELSGFRSVRAAGQRYRVLYKVDGNTVTVLVVLAGLRKEGDKSDVYTLAKKLLRLGLIDPDQSTP
ncbi:MAG TPA: type II toxin-antitoxin system RelE/ParE family toxin [Ktedonobacterales bacterium]